MGCCRCSESLGGRQISRCEFLSSFLLSIFALSAVLVTSWRIETEHNYLLESIYFYMTLIPSCLGVFSALVIFVGVLTPKRLNRCIGNCCCYTNNFYGLFAWCDPLLFFVLQVIVWVPFVSIGRVQVAHTKLANNISLNPQELYHDERLDLFDIGEWPWTTKDYNLDLLFVQSCYLVIVIIRLFLPRGGISFSEMLKCAALWLTEALDLLAFLDDLNAEVLEHQFLPYAVAVAASVSSLQFLFMCTFIYYPAVFAKETASEEEIIVKGARYRLGLTIASAFLDDIPLLVIRSLIFKDIYLPKKQISALYFFFMFKSFLFGCMGLGLACIEGYKCTTDGHNNAVTPIVPLSIKMSEAGLSEDQDQASNGKGKAAELVLEDSATTLDKTTELKVEPVTGGEIQKPDELKFEIANSNTEKQNTVGPTMVEPNQKTDEQKALEEKTTEN
ncbi:uncharacterized protein [Ptychodera flava]|uniref:uncharacterized protein n=1 Tax=Ptychodera flava TaxID=63121 RepID=UPI00396A6D2C